MVTLVGKSYGQNFLNPDLNGNIIGHSNLPINWQNVPATDINCQALILGHHDTPDLTDLVNPLATSGINGNPYSGLTFVSGLRSNAFHEGIMQTITGLLPGNSYSINFQQSVVKQINCRDQSGSWAVYFDNTLAGVALSTFNNASFNSTSFIWEPRSVTFTATANSHTIKFLPHDDDSNLNLLYTDSNGCIRMGIDSIFLVPCLTINLNSGNDTIVCQGDTLILDATTPNATYLWQDNSTNPTFNVTQQGSYWVQITNNCGSISDTINVNYNPTPKVELGNDTSLCQGETLILDATTSNATYLWQDNSTNPTVNITQQGTYWVQITDNCGSTSDTINVNYNPTPTVELGNNTSLCQGETLILDATTSNATYLWQDNSTNPTFNVTQQGTYWVQITDNCGSISDTINVNYNPTPTVELGNDTSLCQGETLILDATTSNATYLWQDNSTNPTVNITQQGTYWVQITDNCGSTSDTIIIDLTDCNCILYVPNSFTPNFDNINDQFLPIISECDFKEYSLMVFNRWGEKIFETNNYYDSWDGTYQERLCQNGVYIYLLQYSYDSGYEQKYGHVTLLK
jgi:gliding motility-associated-like protein